MARWIILFLIATIITGIVAFTDLVNADPVASRIVFAAFLVLLIISVIIERGRHPRVEPLSGRTMPEGREEKDEYHQ